MLEILDKIVTPTLFASLWHLSLSIEEITGNCPQGNIYEGSFRRWSKPNIHFSDSEMKVVACKAEFRHMAMIKNFIEWYGIKLILQWSGDWVGRKGNGKNYQDTNCVFCILQLNQIHWWALVAFW